MQVVTLARCDVLQELKRYTVNLVCGDFEDSFPLPYPLKGYLLPVEHRITPMALHGSTAGAGEVEPNVTIPTISVSHQVEGSTFLSKRGEVFSNIS